MDIFKIGLLTYEYDKAVEDYNNTLKRKEVLDEMNINYYKARFEYIITEFRKFGYRMDNVDFSLSVPLKTLEKQF